MSVEKRRSRLWFLMPVMFGLIGTAIAYFVLRDDDPKFHFYILAKIVYILDYRLQESCL